MTASVNYAKIVKVVSERDATGAWVATSPDLPGFEAVSQDRQDLMERLVPKYLADMFAASGCPMIVAPVENDITWVAVPREAAEHAPTP
jgi:hypothetical protein